MSERIIEALKDVDETKLSPEQFEAYQAIKTKYAQDLPISNVKNEKHPDISWSDRAVVKNFANNPDVSLKYLQKQHPQLQFSKDNEGIIVKRPDELSWKRLDPTGFDWEDLTDVGYDVASTVGEVGAGVALGIPTGGLGGAAAAGATGAALDAARQGIGNLLGLDQEFDVGSTAVSGGLGLAAPLALGTLKPAAYQAKALLKMMPKAEAKLAKQAGVTGLKDSSNIFSELAGGVGDKELDKALKGKAEKLSKESLEEYEKSVLEQARYNTSNLPSKLVKQAANVPAYSARNAMEKVSDEMAETLGVKKGSKLIDVADEISEEGSPEMIDKFIDKTSKTVSSIKKQLSDVYDSFKGREGSEVEIGSTEKVFKNKIAEINRERAEQGLKKLDESKLKEIKNFLKTEIPKKKTIDFAYATKLRNKLQDLIEFKGSKFLSMDKYDQEMSALYKSAHSALTESLNKVADKLSGGKSKALANAWKQSKELEDSVLSKHFGSPEKLQNYLLKPDPSKQTGRLILQKTKKIDAKFGTNLTEMAKIAQTLNKWADPSVVAQSGRGTTGTAASSLGSETAMLFREAGKSEPNLKKNIFGVVGRVGLSPAAVKAGMKAKNLLGKPFDKWPQAAKDFFQTTYQLTPAMLREMVLKAQEE